MATKYRSIRVNAHNYQIMRLDCDYTGMKDWVHEAYINASCHDDAISNFRRVKEESYPKEFEL